MTRKEIRILRAAFNEDIAERWQEVEKVLLEDNLATDYEKIYKEDCVHES